MRLSVRVALVLLLATSLQAAKPKQAKLPPLQPMIDRAKAAVVLGDYDIQRDLAPLIERLGTTRDAEEQDDLLDTLEDLGRYDKSTPAAVKAYIRDSAAPAILAIVRSDAPGSVRGDALLLLRALNVEVPVLDEAIAIAAADTSPDQRAIKFRGSLLEQWKSSRPANETATPSDNEQAALEYLRARRVAISAYSLGIAAMNGDAELVAALLDAGVPVDAEQVAGTPLNYAVGCAAAPKAPGRLATVELLLARGANAKWTDGNNNTLLMFAVDCPVPVVAKLLDAGASLHAANAMGFDALQSALMRGRWEVAELLVARGARLTDKQIDAVFFERPDDPEKLALLRRATKK